MYRTMIFAAFILIALMAQTEGGYSGHCDGNKLLDTMQHMMKCKGHSGHRSRQVFVGFDSVLTKYLKGQRAGHVINFDGVLTNIGNGYKNGVFTCPVPGVYYFSWTILAYKTTNSDTFLMLNGAKRRYNYTRVTSIPHPGTASILLHLNKGDRVWIQMSLRGSDVQSYHSFFSGMLITSD